MLTFDDCNTLLLLNDSENRIKYLNIIKSVYNNIMNKQKDCTDLNTQRLYNMVIAGIEQQYFYTYNKDSDFRQIQHLIDQLCDILKIINK